MSYSQKKFSLLFIAKDKYPPLRVDVSELFAEKLSSRGHTIDWILQSDIDCGENYSTKWCDSHVWVGKTDNGVSLLSRFRKHLYGIINDLRMFKLCYSRRYDFIQVRDKFLSSIIAIIAARMFNAKFVFWLSFPFPEESLYQFAQGTARYPILYFIRGKILSFILYRVIAKYATHIFVQSDEMLRDVVSKGIPSRKLTSVPMGVSEDDLYRCKYYNCHSALSESRVVYIGALDKERKLDFVVRSFFRVLQTHPECKLYFVGDSDDASDKLHLIQEVERLNIEKSVVFTGFLPRNDALEIVGKANVCISPITPSPIYRVASPTKIIEYMALGKAVVANDQPDQLLIIDGSKGGLCVKYSEIDFANAICYLLDHPDIAKKMGERGRAYVIKNRSYNKIADDVEAEYQQIRDLVLKV